MNIPLPNYLIQILESIKSLGGRGILVGGIVRDTLMGKDSKDIDIEVYGLSYEKLENILSQYGKTNLVGKAFGVLKFVGPDKQDFDFSLPRKDSKSGEGHKDFKVTVDNELTPKEAFGRRDLTINAIGFDPLNKEIIDPYGGVRDLNNKILRHTTNAFSEDALRPLRMMQFLGRFPGFKVAPETMQLVKSMKDQYRHLPKERVGEEFTKLVEKGVMPGDALNFLYNSEWSENFPRLHQIKSVPQDPIWHPEGLVNVHTAHVMNAAAEIADREGLKGDDRAVLIFAALTHDLAKSLPEHGGTTMLREKDGEMRWTSHGHEEAGGPMAKELLNSMGIKKDIVDRVVPLVQNHLQHIQFKPESSVSQVRQLAARLHPATMNELGMLIEADHSGRPPLPKEMPEQARMMLDMAKTDGNLNNRPPQMIQGRDILPYYGGKPGKHIGDDVQASYRAYLKGSYNTPEEGQIWLKNYLKGKAGIIRGQQVLPYFDGKPGPHIGAVTNAAWDAQLAGEFHDEQTASNWLNDHLSKNNYNSSKPV